MINVVCYNCFHLIHNWCFVWKSRDLYAPCFALLQLPCAVRIICCNDDSFISHVIQTVVLFLFFAVSVALLFLELLYPFPSIVYAFFCYLVVVFFFRSFFININFILDYRLHEPIWICILLCSMWEMWTLHTYWWVSKHVNSLISFNLHNEPRFTFIRFDSQMPSIMWYEQRTNGRTDGWSCVAVYTIICD